MFARKEDDRQLDITDFIMKEREHENGNAKKGTSQSVLACHWCCEIEMSD